jgi:hypothetical protein
MTNVGNKHSSRGLKDIEMHSAKHKVEYQRLNLYEPTSMEVLPKGTFKNSQYLLIKECEVVPQSILDLVFLQKEVIHLKKHMIIFRFIDRTPNLHAGWLNELQKGFNQEE